MSGRMGMGALVLVILAVVFGFNKLSDLSNKSEELSKSIVYGYFNEVKTKKYENAYQSYFHPLLKEKYDISGYIKLQKDNEFSLGELKEYRVIQIRNGAGFSKIDDFTIYLELKYSNSTEDIVVRIKRKEEDSETFLIDGIWKGSYNRSALHWEKRIY